MRNPRHCCVAGSALLMAAGLVLAQGCKADQRNSIEIKVQLPLEDAGAKVLVDGREFPGTGAERSITFPNKAGADSIMVTATWEPNNYTKITRGRKVGVAGPIITVDLRSPSDTEKDDIKVRWVPTPEAAVVAMCELGRVTSDDVVYDLGCGDGIMVFTAVKKFNAKRGVGVDLDKDLVLNCKNKARAAGISDKVEFRVGDVLKVEDMSDATVVLLYMGDDINQRLKPILQKTLKPGSRVVSHRFLMGDDWPPDKTEQLNVDGKPIEIHLWEIKGQK